MRNRRKLILLIFFSVLITVYLNRSYARLYDSIKSKDLQPPIHQEMTTLGQGREITYVSLGDSLTAGVGASSYGSIYPYIFAQKLSIGAKVTLINLAQQGATTDSLISDQLPIVSKLHPNLVTLLIGINDLHDMKSVSSFKKNYQYIISVLKSSGAKIILLNIPNLGDQEVLLTPWKQLYDLRSTQYNSVIESFNLEVVDLYSLTKQQFSINMYSSDLFHPSDLGYRVWAQSLNAN